MQPSVLLALGKPVREYYRVRRYERTRVGTVECGSVTTYRLSRPKGSDEQSRRVLRLRHFGAYLQTERLLSDLFTVIVFVGVVGVVATFLLSKRWRWRLGAAGVVVAAASC